MGAVLDAISIQILGIHIIDMGPVKCINCASLQLEYNCAIEGGGG